MSVRPPACIRVAHIWQTFVNSDNWKLANIHRENTNLITIGQKYRALYRRSKYIYNADLLACQECQRTPLLHIHGNSELFIPVVFLHKSETQNKSSQTQNVFSSQISYMFRLNMVNITLATRKKTTHNPHKRDQYKRKITVRLPWSA